MTDRRRLNGPELSTPPVFQADQIDSDASGRNKGKRRTRSVEQIRPIYLKPGLINQANGSAYIETEKSKIACAVYGPRQSRNTTYSEKGRLNVEVKFAPFSYHRRKAPIRDAEDRSLSVLVHQTIAPSIRLDLLPKSTLDIFIIIIESDGVENCVSASAIAASTALADAGVELYGLVASCSACLIDREIRLDPTDEEASLAQGTVTVACLPALKTITSTWQTGQMSADQAMKCIEMCQQRCNDIHSVVAQALLDDHRSKK